jgi:hypothetical protein
MNRFTRAVLCHLLRLSSTRKTVQAWLDAEPDRDKRATDFASALREDLIKEIVPSFERLPHLENELMYEALMHVNWRRVAEELLDRFSPKLLAGYCSTPSIN